VDADVRRSHEYQLERARADRAELERRLELDRAAAELAELEASIELELDGLSRRVHLLGSGRGRIPVSATTRRRVMAAGACFYCGSPDRLELEHVHPISRGGTNRLDNLVAACFPCNRNKRGLTVDEWRDRSSSSDFVYTPVSAPSGADDERTPHDNAG